MAVFMEVLSLVGCHLCAVCRPAGLHSSACPDKAQQSPSGGLISTATSHIEVRPTEASSDWVLLSLRQDAAISTAARRGLAGYISPNYEDVSRDVEGGGQGAHSAYSSDERRQQSAGGINYTEGRVEVAPPRELLGLVGFESFPSWTGEMDDTVLQESHRLVVCSRKKVSVLVLFLNAV